ncbi:MAG: terminase TerL endonuclease subunit [Pseudomonadota bacterium]|jgi:phage terminase large subunit-like protein
MGDFHVDHVIEARDYADRVLGGQQPACKWVKAACQRHIDDLATAEQADYAYEFRPELAARVISFVELLRHVKGKWRGARLELEPWQKFVLACVFGWVRKSDGMRRFRTVYLEVPRKNAKTTLLGGVGLYMLVADGEGGAEVYSAATTRDQAKIVFEIAQQMTLFDGQFRARFGVEALTNALLVKDTASKMTPLSAEGSTLDGLNVSCALIDELHAHKTRTVHDVLDSGTGSRQQPLLFKITTAGSNRAGVCYDQRNYLTKVLNATLRRHGGMGYRVDGDAADDESFWGLIYTIDDQDDPFDETTWAKANPNLGVSVELEDMRRMAAVAKVQAASLSEFLTKRLNVWVNADAAWMNMAAWDACARTGAKPAELAGESCVTALDAAFIKDLFSRVTVWRIDGKWRVHARHYAPEALLQRKGNEQLLAWAADGWIRTTPGEVLDIEVVREELLADAKAYDMREVAFDPWQLRQFASEMMDEGLVMVEMRANVQTFSEPMKALDRLVAAGELEHDGDPVLGWMVSNVVCHYDAKDNIYPRKERPEQKIDGAIALIMALGRAMVNVPDEAPGIEVV